MRKATRVPWNKGRRAKENVLNYLSTMADLSRMDNDPTMVLAYSDIRESLAARWNMVGR